MNPPWVKWIAGGMVVGLLIGILIGRGRPADPVLIATNDTVLAEAPRVQAVTDSAKAVADSLERVARDAVRDSRRAKGEAARLRRVADSLRALPPTVDTVVAYDTLAAAYDRLQVAYDSLDSAYQSQVKATAALRVALANDSAYTKKLLNQLGASQKELKRARVHGACQVGTVSGGWNPLGGGAGIVVGVSCGLLPLARSVF